MLLLRCPIYVILQLLDGISYKPWLSRLILSFGPGDIAPIVMSGLYIVEILCRSNSFPILSVVLITKGNMACPAGGQLWTLLFCCGFYIFVGVVTLEQGCSQCVHFLLFMSSGWCVSLSRRLCAPRNHLYSLSFVLSSGLQIVGRPPYAITSFNFHHSPSDKDSCVQIFSSNQIGQMASTAMLAHMHSFVIFLHSCGRISSL